MRRLTLTSDSVNVKVLDKASFTRFNGEGPLGPGEFRTFLTTARCVLPTGSHAMRNLVSTIANLTHDVLDLVQAAIAGRVTRNTHLFCQLRLLLSRLTGRPMPMYAPVLVRAKRAAGGGVGNADSLRLSRCSLCWRPLRRGTPVFGRHS